MPTDNAATEDFGEWGKLLTGMLVFTGIYCITDFIGFGVRLAISIYPFLLLSCNKSPTFIKHGANTKPL